METGGMDDANSPGQTKNSPGEPSFHGNPVRRPMNAFLIFCKRHRAVVRDRNIHLDNRSITKILGELWANLVPEEKSIYVDLAKQYKDAFMRANPDYKWHDPSRTGGLQAMPKSPTKLLPGLPLAYSGPHTGSHPLDHKSGITPGKLADPCNMGGLSLLLMAGQHSLSPETTDVCTGESRHKPDHQGQSSTQVQQNVANVDSLFAEMCTSKTKSSSATTSVLTVISSANRGQGHSAESLSGCLRPCNPSAQTDNHHQVTSSQLTGSESSQLDLYCHEHTECNYDNFADTNESIRASLQLPGSAFVKKPTDLSESGVQTKNNSQVERTGAGWPQQNRGAASDLLRVLNAPTQVSSTCGPSLLTLPDRHCPSLPHNKPLPPTRPPTKPERIGDLSQMVVERVIETVYSRNLLSCSPSDSRGHQTKSSQNLDKKQTMMSPEQGSTKRLVPQTIGEIQETLIRQAIQDLGPHKPCSTSGGVVSWFPAEFSASLSIPSQPTVTDTQDTEYQHGIDAVNKSLHSAAEKTLMSIPVSTIDSSMCPNTTLKPGFTSGPGLAVTSGLRLAVTSGPGLTVTSGPGLTVTSGPGLAETSGPGLAVTSGPRLTVTSGPMSVVHNTFETKKHRRKSTGVPLNGTQNVTSASRQRPHDVKRARNTNSEGFQYPAYRTVDCKSSDSISDRDHDDNTKDSDIGSVKAGNSKVSRLNTAQQNQLNNKRSNVKHKVKPKQSHGKPLVTSDNLHKYGYHDNDKQTNMEVDGESSETSPGVLGEDWDLDVDPSAPRKSKRSNRGQRYQALLSQGLLQPARRKTDPGDDNNNQMIPACQRSDNITRQSNKVRRRTISESTSDDGEFLKRYRPGDFDLDAHIASLPMCDISSGNVTVHLPAKPLRVHFKSLDAGDLRCDIDPRLMETSMNTEDPDCTDVVTIAELQCITRCRQQPSVHHTDTPATPPTGSRKRKARKKAITHLIPMTSCSSTDVKPESMDLETMKENTYSNKNVTDSLPGVGVDKARETCSLSALAQVAISEQNCVTSVAAP